MAALQGLALLMTVTLYGDVVGGGYGREASRLHETRSLLREGEVPPFQHRQVPTTHSSVPVGGQHA